MVDEYDVLAIFRRLALAPKSADNNTVTLNKTVVRDLLKMALSDRFDEEWYLARYKDVAEAVRKGAIRTGFDHYSSAGVYEGRIPYPFAIDELDYLNRHRDVARSLKEGPYDSAAEHFYTVGFLEGRGFQIALDEPEPAATGETGARAETATQ